MFLKICQPESKSSIGMTTLHSDAPGKNNASSESRMEQQNKAGGSNFTEQGSS
jgi:hypothetical protein